MDFWDEDNWGRICTCGHSIGSHNSQGRCVECKRCRKETVKLNQVRLAGEPE